MSMYGRKQTSIVKQLSLNQKKKNRVKIEILKINVSKESSDMFKMTNEHEPNFPVERLSEGDF